MLTLSTIAFSSCGEKESDDPKAKTEKDSKDPKAEAETKVPTQVRQWRMGQLFLSNRARSWL